MDKITLSAQIQTRKNRRQHTSLCFILLPLHQFNSFQLTAFFHSLVFCVCLLIGLSRDFKMNWFFFCCCCCEWLTNFNKIENSKSEIHSIITSLPIFTTALISGIINYWSTHLSFCCTVHATFSIKLIAALIYTMHFPFYTILTHPAVSTNTHHATHTHTFTKKEVHAFICIDWMRKKKWKSKWSWKKHRKKCKKHTRIKLIYWCNKKSAFDRLTIACTFVCTVKIRSLCDIDKMRKHSMLIAWTLLFSESLVQFHFYFFFFILFPFHISIENGIRKSIYKKMNRKSKNTWRELNDNGTHIRKIECIS